MEAELLQDTQSGNIDEEDIDMSKFSEENNCLKDLIDALGYFIKLHGDEYMLILDRAIGPILSEFMQLSASFALQNFAIDLLSDIFECGGSYSSKYITTFLPTILSRLVDSADEDVRQSCSYAILQVVKNHVDVTTSCLGEVISIKIYPT